MLDKLNNEIKAVIENNSALIVDEYLAEAFESGSGTYLYAHARSESPFMVGLRVSTRTGDVATLDLREDILEAFDDPATQKSRILAVAKAMRDFAQELEDKIGAGNV